MLGMGLWMLLIGVLVSPVLLLGFKSVLLICLVASSFAMGLVLAAFGWWYGRPEIVLLEKGVTFQGKRYQVFCPWALFSAPGEPFFRPGIPVPETVILPIAPEYVSLIEIREDGNYIGHDRLRRARHLFTLTKSNQMSITGWYQANLAEVGALLLKLGQAMPAAGNQVAARALHESPIDSMPVAVQPRSNGWVTVNLTHLKFPEACCRCTKPTSKIVTSDLSPRWSWIWGALTHLHTSLELPLPVCENCQANHRKELQLGATIGAIAGLTIFGGGSLLCGADAVSAWLLLAVGLFIGGMYGWQIAERPPLSVTQYSLRKGTVTLRFRNRGYTEIFLRHLGAASDD